MKGMKLLSAKADKDSGVSIVRIGTDMGEFEGIAECCLEDYPNFSNYFGCSIAEIRAMQKYAKAKVKDIRAQLKSLRDFYKTMEGTRTWDPNAFYVKKLLEHSERLNKELIEWKNKVELAEKGIKVRTKEHDIIVSKIKERADDSIN